MTTVRHAILGVICVMAMAPAVTAQIVIDAKPGTLPPVGQLFATGPRLASAADAELLIRATLGAPGSYGETVLRRLTAKDFYVVLHVMKWSDPTFDAANKATQTVQSQNWYVYRGGDGWRQADFNARRLYGARDFYVLVVHLNRSPDTEDYRLNYRVTIVKKQPANIANLAAAAKLLGLDFDAIKLQSAREPQNLWAGAHVPVDDVPSDITIAPEIVALAAPGAAPASTSTTTTGASVTAAGFTRIDDAATKEAAMKGAAAKKESAAATATDTAIAALKSQLAALEKQVASARSPTPQSLGDGQKFDNEGKYFWDVSVGIPVRGVSDFTRNEAGLNVKTVSKDTAFVMANIYFKPVDVKTPALNVWPHALIGFGIEDKPLGRIFVGGGWGPVYANFFAGVAFKKVKETKDYEHEVTFGLNMPILAITKRLADQTK